MQKNILVIEDDNDTRLLIKEILNKDEIKTYFEDEPKNIMDLIYKINFDLIILDLVMPKVDGIQLFHFLKRNEISQNIPILILSGRKSESDIILGLEIGAEDYITKPFEPRILFTRVHNILRRKIFQSANDPNFIRYGNFTFDLHRFDFRIQEKHIELTRSEFYIMKLLCSNPGWVFNRKQILNAIHGSERPISIRSVDVMILNLRNKIKPKDFLLETVRGIGYRMKEFKTQKILKVS